MSIFRGDISLIVEFGACLNEWKQSKRAPLLERKLAMRKELDRLMEISRDKTEATAEMTQLRTDLATLQKRLDEARNRWNLSPLQVARIWQKSSEWEYTLRVLIIIHILICII